MELHARRPVSNTNFLFPFLLLTLLFLLGVAAALLVQLPEGGRDDGQGSSSTEIVARRRRRKSELIREVDDETPLLLLLPLLAPLPLPVRGGKARGGSIEEGWEELPLGVRIRFGKPRFFFILSAMMP